MAAPSPTSRSQRAKSSRLFRCRCNDCRSRATWSRRREYRVEKPVAKLGGRHRSSVVELSIRNRAVVGSNPTGGSVFSALLLAFLRLPFPAPARGELVIDTPFDRG